MLACIVSLYPLVWMIFGSLKSGSNFYTNLWGPPAHPAWHNYAAAWSQGDIGRYFFNSIFVTLATIVLVSVLGYLLAFGVARLRFRGSGVVIGVMAITLFVPIQLLLIPLYVLEVHIHLVDTRWALILPYTAGSLPFAALFLTAYLRSIPNEVEEAAMVDGCNRLRVLWHIILPLSRPAFATVVIFTFLNAWNEFLLALTLVQNNALRTLPVGLLNFSQSTGQTNYSDVFAALTVAVIPIIAVFVVFQRQFIEGLTAGAVNV